MPTSRQAVCGVVVGRCVRNVLRYEGQMHKENRELVKEKVGEVAEHYVDKVLGRIDRIMDGESIGSMIDSDLENLSVDKNFEIMRH